MSIVIQLPNRGASNIYHWFIYIVSELKDILNKNNDVHLIYPTIDNILDYQEITLKKLIPPQNIHRSRDTLPPHFIELDLPCVINSYFYDYYKSYYQFLRLIFPPPIISPNINITYISRNDSFYSPHHKGIATRCVINENELVEHFGIIPHSFSFMPFNDQLNLFQSSKYIISSHGSALTYALFMHPDSIIIELNSNPISFPHFKHICDLLGLKIIQIFCTCLDKNESIIAPIDIISNIINANGLYYRV